MTIYQHFKNRKSILPRNQINQWHLLHCSASAELSAWDCWKTLSEDDVTAVESKVWRGVYHHQQSVHHNHILKKSTKTKCYVLDDLWESITCLQSCPLQIVISIYEAFNIFFKADSKDWTDLPLWCNVSKSDHYGSSHFFKISPST